MNVLALIHGEQVRSGTFGAVVAAGGHRLEEWSAAWEQPLPRPLDDYGAVFVLGGSMHADEEERHPWLREETLLLQGLLHRGTPVLGVCLGAQMLARAAHAPVYTADAPEVGWFDVELTGAAADDPVFRALPERFSALEWHYYTYDLPPGAVELARSAVCTQGFRLGESCWGVQFHPEVTEPQLERWIADKSDLPADPERLRTETRERIGGWNELGRRLGRSFLAAALALS